MSSAPRLFVLAGEPSGDRLGADLVKRLRVRVPILLLGVGGPELEGEGLKSIFPMQDLSVMGVADVVLRLPLLLWRLRQTVRSILRTKPDIVILIDSQVFSQAVAQRLRDAGYQGKVLLYVAPSVWAWKPERAPAIRTIYDEVLAILPFEPAAMKMLGGPKTAYVGHPALEQQGLRAAQPDRGPLLLLPGSRPGELKRHLPLMKNIATALQSHPRVSGIVVPTVRGQIQRVSREVTKWPVAVTVTADPDQKRQAFAEAVAAVAVSGTVTLELALVGVPMIVTYIGDRAQRAAAEKYRIRFIALPNILADRALVPEYWATRPRLDEIVAALGSLLGDPVSIAAQRDGFAKIRAELADGLPDAPRVDAADVVEDYLRLLRGT